MKIMKDTWMHLSLHGNGLLTIFEGALPVEEDDSFGIFSNIRFDT